MGLVSIRTSVLTRKLQRNLEDYGWPVTVKKSLAYLLALIYFHQIYRIYKIKLDTAKPRKDFDKPDFAFRIVTAQDADMIAQVESIAEWLRGDLKDRIVAGQLCLVALHREKVVAFNLISFDRTFMRLVNLRKRLRQGNAWSEHITVQKQFRKMGLASQLRQRLFDELKKRGIRRLYGGTLRFNLASLNLARSVGFKEIIDIHYRRFFFFESWQYERVRD